MKTYHHYFFDLDDTLLDFKASEELSFATMLQTLGVKQNQHEIYEVYQVENQKLWAMLEQGKVSKDRLKVLRFEKTFDLCQLDLDPEKASQTYLEALPESVVLIDGAVELLQELATHAEIGIITNGIEHVQRQRIARSPLKDFISFLCVSESCGFAKPDQRFFECAAKMAKNFKKESTLVIGDRYDADIFGAYQFGLDACWFNPERAKPHDTLHLFEVHSLTELRTLLCRKYP